MLAALDMLEAVCRSVLFHGLHRNTGYSTGVTRNILMGRDKGRVRCLTGWGHRPHLRALVYNTADHFSTQAVFSFPPFVGKCVNFGVLFRVATNKAFLIWHPRGKMLSSPPTTQQHLCFIQTS